MALAIVNNFFSNSKSLNAIFHPKLVRQKQTIKCKPFLKWAGGKTQLLPELMERIPRNYNHYFEPFIGGGAMFFALQPPQATLSDINPDLINLYQVVRDSVEALIEDLSTHIYQKEYFYQLRNRDRSPDFKHWTAIQKASRLIYLNKTCFNGLYRVNSKGQFNVPFGRYTNPKICHADNLRACSQALQNVTLKVSHFEDIANKADAGDFVYFDPPYVPINETSSFIGYAKEGFTVAMQIKLRDICILLDQKEVKFMLSNSAVPLILELYQDFDWQLIKAFRSINSKGNKRGKIDEAIIRNYQ